MKERHDVLTDIFMICLDSGIKVRELDLGIEKKIKKLVELDEFKSTQKDVLDAFNPYRQAYIIGYQFEDLFFSGSSSRRIQNRKPRFYSSKACLCLVSYYPFFELHSKILINLLSKKKRGI